MYMEGHGTWFLLRFTMDPPVEFYVVYNNDFDLKCSLNLTADEWALDLERLHRALGARSGQHQVPMARSGEVATDFVVSRCGVSSAVAASFPGSSWGAIRGWRWHWPGGTCQT